MNSKLLQKLSWVPAIGAIIMCGLLLTNDDLWSTRYIILHLLWQIVTTVSLILILF